MSRLFCQIALIVGVAGITTGCSDAPAKPIVSGPGDG